MSQEIARIGANLVTGIMPWIAPTFALAGAAVGAFSVPGVVAVSPGIPHVVRPSIEPSPPSRQRTSLETTHGTSQ
jgi:hypothetical protein